MALSKRHRAREVALQILYQYDSQAQSSQSANQAAALTPQQLIAQLSHHFDHFAVPADLRSFAATLVSGTLNHTTELDEILRKYLNHWKIERLSTVDRNLLRLAIYELTYQKETPPRVVIDEALELAKRFGSEDTVSFVNGILDAIYKSFGPA